MANGTRVLRTRRRFLTLLACLLAALGAATATTTLGLTSGAVPYDWTQFDGDSVHSGNNAQETTINHTNVVALRQLFQVALPDVADGAPVFLHGVTTKNGVEDLLFVTTKDGHIVALDAHSGVTVWSHQYGANGCLINNDASRNEPCYTTSSPAIDPNGQYVYSYGLDGSVHKYRVGDGTEITSGGWPELTTLKRYDEKGSSALSTASDTAGNSYLYVTNGGYPGDAGDYQGHVTAINLQSGTQRVFNAVCSQDTYHFPEGGSTDCPSVQSAIWARAGAVYDPDTNRIYMATGNGDYDPSHHYWGDSVFALNPDGTGNGSGDPLAVFTPSNQSALQNCDLDVGSTAPAILPAPSSSAIKHLAVQGGKGPASTNCNDPTVLRLLNLDDLGGSGAVVQTLDVPQNGEVLTQPAVWVNPKDNSTWVFVANDNGISGLQLTVNSSGTPSLTARWQNSGGGTSPIVVDGVLYYFGGNGIEARDPVGGNLLWEDASISTVHWESPIVAEGTLYITDESGDLTAYNLRFDPVALVRGWNALGDPSTAYGTIGSFVSDVQGQAGSALSFKAAATLAAGRFTVYVPGYSPNFSLHAGQGVFALAGGTGSASWTPRGTPGPAAIALQPGWNFVSLSYPFSTTASTVCTQLSSLGCRELAVYSSGGYQTYTSSGSGTDFTVRPGQGIMLLVTSGGSWTPR